MYLLKAPPFSNLANPIIAYLIVAATFFVPNQSFSDSNLVRNPGFESATGDPDFEFWSKTSTTGGARTVVDAIQGTSVFRSNAGTGNSQDIAISQWVPITPGQEYAFSANFRIKRGVGSFSLLYSTVENPTPVQLKSVELSGDSESKCWQRLVARIPGLDSDQIRIWCQFTDVNGFVFCDMVKVIEKQSLLADSDFENPDGEREWTIIRHAEYSTEQSYFGSHSLRLSTTSPNSAAVVRQQITCRDDPQFADRIFHISAHVLAEDVIPNDEGRLAADFRGGVNFEIQCWGEGVTNVRTIQSPFLMGSTDKFVERSLSFLVPEGTIAIQVLLQIRNATGTAFVDNIRLTSSLPGLATRPFCDPNTVGCKDYVEACEPGTFACIPPGSSESAITEAIASNSGPVPGSGRNRILWFPAGTYPIETQLFVQRGMNLKLHRKATLTRTQEPAIPFGFHSALLRTDGDNDEDVVSDVIIEGGTYDSQDHSGIVMNWRGDRWVIRNFHIPGWSHNDQRGRGISWNGDDAFLYQNKVVGAGGLVNEITSAFDIWKNTEGNGQRGFGGVVMAGGSGAHIFSNFIHAGDDAIGLFTTTRQFSGRLSDGTRRMVNSFDRDIRNVEVYNNILFSNGGRAFACGIARPRDWQNREINDLNSDRMRATVENVRVRQCFGQCGGANQLITINCSPAHPDRDDLGPEDMPPSIRNILVKNLEVIGRLDRPKDLEETDLCAGCLKQNGIFLFTEDCGSLAQIHFDNVHVEGFVATPDELGVDKPSTGYGILIVKAGDRFHREGASELSFDFGALANDNSDISFSGCSVTTLPSLDSMQHSHHYRLEYNPFNQSEAYILELENSFVGSGDRIHECGAVGDRVFLDTNGNGFQEPGELGVANVRIRLVRIENDIPTTVGSFTSDANGRFVFDQIPEGLYRILVLTNDLPAETGFTHQNVGTENRDNDISPDTGFSDTIRLRRCRFYHSLDVGLLNLVR